MEGWAGSGRGGKVEGEGEGEGEGEVEGDGEGEGVHYCVVHTRQVELGTVQWLTFSLLKGTPPKPPPLKPHLCMLDSVHTHIHTYILTHTHTYSHTQYIHYDTDVHRYRPAYTYTVCISLQVHTSTHIYTHSRNMLQQAPPPSPAHLEPLHLVGPVEHRSTPQCPPALTPPPAGHRVDPTLTGRRRPGSSWRKERGGGQRGDRKERGGERKEERREERKDGNSMQMVREVEEKERMEMGTRLNRRL